MGESNNKRKRFNPNAPPPRWHRCPRKGGLIENKFIPFKTPLDDKFQIPMEFLFTPQMMLESLGSYKVKMGLWIDLTNTTRFYDKKYIEGTGIKYLKLQCQGHGECPSVDQTNTFIEVCQRFISKNPLEVIGVHCTHGFNRTGFLIIAYLVESLSWSIEAAVHAFQQVRPPGIYKQDYLNELFRRYGEIEDAPNAPALPQWCNEDDNITDDGVPLDQNSGENHDAKVPPNKKRREFHKKNPVFMEGVPGVTPVTDRDMYTHVQRKCQAMCEWKGSGFPGSQPVSMDATNIQLLHEKPYKVSWKADGTRYMMLIEGENRIFFIDRDNSIFQVSHLFFPRRKNPSKHIFDTLLDGEMIIDKVEQIDVPRYLVYDIIKFETQDVGKTDFDRRLLCIHKEIITPRRTAMESGKIDRCREPFSIRQKDFWDVTTAKRILGEKFRENMSHEVDGLIFQPAKDAYLPGRSIEVLKWKPPNLNSVDFRLEIKRMCGEGLLPTAVGNLYVGGCDTPFATVKMSKAVKSLDKKIIECKYENGEWIFMRERTDKSFPNSFNTAMGVCNSIKNPVTTEKLFEFIDDYRWRPNSKSQSSK